MPSHATDGWANTLSKPSKRLRTSSRTGLSTRTAQTWASAASHPPINWEWPRKFYKFIPLEMGGYRSTSGSRAWEEPAPCGRQSSGAAAGLLWPSLPSARLACIPRKLKVHPNLADKRDRISPAQQAVERFGLRAQILTCTTGRSKLIPGHLLCGGGRRMTGSPILLVPFSNPFRCSKKDRCVVVAVRLVIDDTPRA